MLDAKTHKRIFVALISFERDGGSLGVLEPEMQGAVGWMAAKVENSDQLFECFKKVLSEIGLRIIEMSDELEISDYNEAAEFDEHLVANMREWEPDKKTVWGTIHQYYGDGEA